MSMFFAVKSPPIVVELSYRSSATKKLEKSPHVCSLEHPRRYEK